MGLATVVVKEHAGRAVHLGDDDALGPVDDERAVHRHERHVAHIDVLLLDILDRAGAGLLVDVEHDQPEGDLERRRIGHATLLAFLDIVLRRVERVADKLELGTLTEILDRKDGAKYGLQSLILAPALGLLNHQELIVGLLLNLDEVRHLGHFVDATEHLPQTLMPILYLLRHFHLLARSRRLTGNPACAKAEILAKRRILWWVTARTNHLTWGSPGHLSTHRYLT